MTGCVELIECAVYAVFGISISTGEVVFGDITGLTEDFGRQFVIESEMTCPSGQAVGLERSALDGKFRVISKTERQLTDGANAGSTEIRSSQRSVFQLLVRAAAPEAIGLNYRFWN